jgi:acetolactate synthase-1/2/3 large subunit
MKLSDYVTEFLVKKGVKHVFGITGGTIVHMFDSIGKNPNIEYVCTHHEQAAAMAADAYSRITKNIGVGMATSGPGATNLLTGMCCSYFDSIPTMFITGQAPTSQLNNCQNKTRQIGFQETDISKICQPVTKYSKLVLEPKDIRYELEKAFYTAKEGRAGPVLLDIPDDIQRANINPEELRKYTPRIKKKDLVNLERKINQTIELIENAERPIVIFGAGIKLSNSEENAKKMIEKTQLPFVLTWAAMDLFPNNYSLSARDFGVTANRPGNFAVQNSDLIIALGTRLDTHETGSKLETFARCAKRIVVDIDPPEIEKYSDRKFPIDVPINYDLKDFFYSFNKNISNIKTKNISEWKNRISEWKKKYPSCQESYFESSNQVNPYVFIDALSNQAKEGDIIIPEAGCNLTWAFQGFKIKKNQRMFSAFNNSPMGYGLPASVGTCFANDKKPVIAIIGEGGMMINEHELATISKHELPIKIFVMNNGGYGMMQQTQEVWLGSRYEASTKKDFDLPDFSEIARAHGIQKVEKIDSHNNLDKQLKNVLNYNGPVLCDVKIHPKSRIFPKLSFGKPIEDSEPLLKRKEFLENMIISSLK